MDKQTIQEFHVIGIAVRTSNENGQAAEDIPALWSRFFSEDVARNIPNKQEETIYSVYTDYEKDHTKPYLALIGCKVSNLDSIPEGMVGRVVAGGSFEKFTAIGPVAEGSVYKEWLKIWNSDLKRAYTADFEMYDERSQNRERPEVDIFVALS